MNFFKGLWKLWKHRDQLGYVSEISDAVQAELAKTAENPRPIWQSYRFWSGIILIAGAVLSLAFGVVTFENVMTPEVIGALAAVIAGFAEIFQAKGQVRTERMIAASAAQTRLLAEKK